MKLNLSSNELDLLWLQDGIQGIQGPPGEDGKDSWIWVKYSKKEFLSQILSEDEDIEDRIQDSPEDAIWIGIATEMESPQEENDPTKYKWSKIKGDDGYTVVMSNENITIMVDGIQRSVDQQTYESEVFVYKGSKVNINYSIDIGHAFVPNGMTLVLDGKIIKIIVKENVFFPETHGELSIPINIIDEYNNVITVEKSITFTTIQGAESSLTYTWIKYANSTTPTPKRMYDDSEGMDYVGIAYDKTYSNKSLDYKDYEWIRMNTTGSHVVEIRKLYYKSLYKNLKDIPLPGDLRETLSFNQGVIDTSKGYIEFGQVTWSVNKYSYAFGYYLWTALEIIMDDNTVLYTTPILSEEWAGSEIGGTQLVRNSKTLVDERIIWL